MSIFACLCVPKDVDHTDADGYQISVEASGQQGLGREDDLMSPAPAEALETNVEEPLKTEGVDEANVDEEVPAQVESLAEEKMDIGMVSVPVLELAEEEIPGPPPVHEAVSAPAPVLVEEVPVPVPVQEPPVVVERVQAPALVEEAVATVSVPEPVVQEPIPEVEEVSVPPVVEQLHEVPVPPVPAVHEVPVVPVPAVHEVPVVPVPAVHEVPVLPVPAVHEVPVPSVPAVHEVPVPAVREVPIPEAPVPVVNDVPVPVPVVEEAKSDLVAPVTAEEPLPPRMLEPPAPAPLAASTETVEAFIQSLRDGRVLLKEDRNGTVRERRFFIHDGENEGDSKLLEWVEPQATRRLSFRLKSPDRSVPLSELTAVVEGRDEGEERRLSRRPSFKSVPQSGTIITLVFKSRNVTFVVSSDEEREELIRGFRALISA